MTETSAAQYTALAARDPRFDGVFFVGVTSTGIYCRPICPAKTPRADNCRFFASAEAAEKENFRPCLRCRPELAPGNAPIDDAQRIAHQVALRIEQGLTDGGTNLEDIAAGFDLSSRQIRRIVQKELGVTPIELIQTRRLLMAKQLLTETKMPITQVAFASGFSSLRRFNDVFAARYKMPPTRLRKQVATEDADLSGGDVSTLQLAYRPPYEWDGVLDFLRGRMMAGVELVDETSYRRTVRIGRHKGWISVSHAPEKCALLVSFTHSLAPVLPALLGRLRILFDLNARPDVIAAHLMRDKVLKKAVAKNPGLRVPGAFGGFELSVRAVLGQQINVKAATTLSCRFAEAFGEPLKTPFPELNRLSPLPGRIAKTKYDAIAKLGIVGARAKSIVALAEAHVAARLCLDAGANPEATVSALVALPGIGQWTAQYIAMRALRWPDAFPKEDIAMRNKLGGISAKQAEALSEAWRPWRSYAVMHIWRIPAGLDKNRFEL